MAVTRSRSQQEVKDGPPQLFPVCNPTGKGLALAASSIQAQEKFLDLMGLTINSIDIQKENLFEDQDALVIATALNHDATLPDTEMTLISLRRSGRHTAKSLKVS